VLDPTAEFDPPNMYLVMPVPPMTTTSVRAHAPVAVAVAVAVARAWPIRGDAE